MDRHNRAHSDFSVNDSRTLSQQTACDSNYRVIFPSTRQRSNNNRSNSTAAHLAYSPLATGGLIPPHTSIARAVLMGNTTSEETSKEKGYQDQQNAEGLPLALPKHHPNQQPQLYTSGSRVMMTQQSNRNQRPKSGLSVLLDHEQQRQQKSSSPTEEEVNCTCDHSSPSDPLSRPDYQHQVVSSSQVRSPALSTGTQDEADSASGPPPPPPPPPPTVLGHSAPTVITTLPLQKNRRMVLPTGTPPSALFKCSCTPPNARNGMSLPGSNRHQRQSSLGQSYAPGNSFFTLGGSDQRVRRCMSSKELGTLAPPSGSPYADMLHQREALENEMRDRLRLKRDSIALEPSPQNSPQELAPIHQQHQHPRRGSGDDSKESSTTSSQKNATTLTNIKAAGVKETRHQRRAAHNRAVVEDLCEVVADLFVAESKLINPSKYGVGRSLGREQVLKTVKKFVAALPTRYALGADTPSEVLLHMRLMAVARSDPSKAVVHIVNLENDSYWTDNCAREKSSRQLRLVTICCGDAVGLLEYITKILGTGGSRVLDADVMLSSDRIVLDRFVVEMNGRLRLDKVAHLIESFLKKAKGKDEHDRLHKDDCSCQEDGDSHGTHSISATGPLYYNPEGNTSSNSIGGRDLEEEITQAVPLTEVLASPIKSETLLDPNFAQLRRHFSMPNELACHGNNGYAKASQSGVQPTYDALQNDRIYTPRLTNSHHGPPLEIPLEPRWSSHHGTHLLDSCPGQPEQPCPTHGVQILQPPPLACPAHGVPISSPCPAHGLQPRLDSSVDSVAEYEDDDTTGSTTDGTGESMRGKRPLVNRRAAPDLDRVAVEGESVDYVSVPQQYIGHSKSENRVVPLIPFDELMLIQAIGTGRVSTIYRAAWQNPTSVQMVALKVAMVNPDTGDLSHVDELRREADIAARLKHPNVCDLVGVAADSECFCLAYDYCEGGSVLSLLSDTSRYYEYLPIALDVANGMAYLHSRDVIHRDLKPSNILLTRDHRAKIADFGMSVANAGQELTAETGTYRYMAPEVIRHESYSSNADVYSFGVFLWQLISRQVPFASMTPVQAAYAVAEGRRPEIADSTPVRLKEIIEACWDQDSHKRPSFTYIAMALADYVKMSFSPASVGAQTLQIANDMLATVEGNSNVNVDFTTTVAADPFNDSAVGLEI